MIKNRWDLERVFEEYQTVQRLYLSEWNGQAESDKITKHNRQAYNKTKKVISNCFQFIGFDFNLKKYWNSCKRRASESEELAAKNINMFRNAKRELEDVQDKFDKTETQELKMRVFNRSTISCNRSDYSYVRKKFLFRFKIIFFILLI